MLRRSTTTGLLQRTTSRDRDRARETDPIRSGSPSRRRRPCRRRDRSRSRASGISLRASAMPCGSYARTRGARAPASAGTITRLGASRMSSVFGLKVRPSTAMRLALQRAAAGGDDLVGHRALARVVHRDHGLDDPHRRAVALRRCAISAAVSFGKHEPPKPGPACRNFRADAAVEPHAARDLLHVGADLLAQVRHLVDERDLGREERVGGVLDQLGGAPAGEQDRRLVDEQRPVDLAASPGARARPRCRPPPGPDA